MKKCPNCEQNYDNDSLKFCQTDGTPLVDVAEQVEDDPYKTIVGNQSDISSIIGEQDKEKIKSAELPVDPFQTMVAPPLSAPKTEPQEPVEEDILDLGDDDGDEIDPMKTMAISSNTVDNIKVNVPEESQAKDYSASSFDDSKSSTGSGFEVPSFNEVPAQTESKDESQFGQPNNKGFADDDVNFDKTTSSVPIPSPFDESMPPGYTPPSTPPFEPPKEPLKPEALNEKQNVPPMSPFAEPETNKLENSADDWSPLDPSFSGNENPGLTSNAPVGDWGNNEISSNSPSDVSAAATEGQNMTLSYISLATGVLSMTLCFWIGIVMGSAGIVTGFLARKKIAENPSQYGGDKFALIGMITGVVGLIIWFGLIILIYSLSV